MSPREFANNLEIRTGLALGKRVRKEICPQLTLFWLQELVDFRKTKFDTGRLATA